MLEWDLATVAALAVRHADPPRCGVHDRAAQPRAAGALALVDVADQDRAGLGTAQAGAAEKMKQRKIGALGLPAREASVRADRAADV